MIDYSELEFDTSEIVGGGSGGSSNIYIDKDGNLVVEGATIDENNNLVLNGSNIA